MKWRSPSPVDDKITLVRPLLNAAKAELREFARANKIYFREDATNAQLDLPRNRVRNELLPLLRRRYQPALTRTILRLMEIVGAEADFIGETAQRWLDNLKRGQRAPRPVPLPARRGEGGRPVAPKRSVGGRSGEGNVFGELPVAVQRRVLQLQLTKLGVLADFELVERIRRSPDVFVSVGPGFSAARNATGRVNLRAQPPVGFKVNELTVNLTGRAGEANFADVQFHWDFEGVNQPIRLGKQTGRELFDADRVGGRITLRHWQAGDRFQPIGLKSAVKLQDLFTNQKIPRARRRDLIVAEAASGKIFWVEHLRMAEHFKLTPGTKRRLVWRWRGGSPLNRMVTKTLEFNVQRTP
jgi:tRNA(Ile)-lysidine synthase